MQNQIEYEENMDQKESPFVIENLEEDTGFLVLQISALWEEYHERVLKKYYNLSHMQYAVLASIYWLVLHSGKEVTQIILARHTKIAPMTISQILKRLEAKGYIYRNCHSTDIRAKSLHLTEEGRVLMNKAVATIIQIDKKFFKVLGKNVTRFNQYILELLKANE
ncbi:MAG: MarR family transcriptional regulator [Candidatus Symbiothrix sp.]|nr:MarR family transcriptional regulator [Candidatus Symbiothrix sp.]